MSSSNYPSDVLTPSSRVVKEHMFHKVVTPSDVGKLNRLVIPKQHAERYFPLDSSTNEKGLVLDFEDRNGKAWRFRYSYWTSSQSYVMTKGWSRFVKEKNLDPGDTVSFHRAGKDRFFIDWAHRSDQTLNQLSFHKPNLIHYPLFLQPSSSNYSHHYHPYGNNIVVVGNPCRPSTIVYPGSSGGGFATSAQRGRMVERVKGKSIRLFGVNMDCESSESDNQYHDTLPNLSLDSSSSCSSVRSLELRPYEPEKYNHSKGKGSMSLDLDI